MESAVDSYYQQVTTDVSGPWKIDFSDMLKLDNGLCPPLKSPWNEAGPTRISFGMLTPLTIDRIDAGEKSFGVVRYREVEIEGVTEVGNGWFSKPKTVDPKADALKWIDRVLDSPFLKKFLEEGEKCVPGFGVWLARIDAHLLKPVVVLPSGYDLDPKCFGFAVTLKPAR